jgi:hypothetical protein
MLFSREAKIGVEERTRTTMRSANSRSKKRGKVREKRAAPHTHTPSFHLANVVPFFAHALSEEMVFLWADHPSQSTLYSFPLEWLMLNSGGNSHILQSMPKS